MSTTFFGTGNLGVKPVLKYVTVGNESRAVAEVSVRFDRSAPDGDGGFVDKGGFWADVSIWGAAAERAARFLESGARVFVVGSILEENWTGKEDGAEHRKMAISADGIYPDLLRVESIVFKQKAVTGSDAA